MSRISSSVGIFLLAIFVVVPRIHAQNASDPVAEFKRLAAELSASRLNGTDEVESEQEKPLVYLDSLASSVLNGSAKPDVDVTNQRLAGLVSHTPPVGENYRLIKLGGTPVAYALVANFGLGGPAAVRIYASSGGRYSLAAKVDHFAQKDFFDSDVELVAVSYAEPVFVTVTGRTDVSTGIFSAWRFDGNRLALLWTTDLLQQIDEADANGFHLAYCGQVDEDHPDHCLKMTRDVYRFQSGEWKRIETKDDQPPTKPASK